MAPVDLDRLRLRSRPLRPPRLGLPRPVNGQRFLKGPIPLPWLEAAALLPGKSLHVAVALWYLGGLQKCRVIALSNIVGARFGLDRNSKYRGLAALEDAGLITIVRKLGRAPLVTLNDFEPARPTEQGEENP